MKFCKRPCITIRILSQVYSLCSVTSPIIARSGIIRFAIGGTNGFRNGTCLLLNDGRQRGLRKCVRGPELSRSRPCAGESIIGSVYQSDGRSARPARSWPPAALTHFLPSIVSLLRRTRRRARCSESMLSEAQPTAIYSGPVFTACPARARVT